MRSSSLLVTLAVLLVAAPMAPMAPTPTASAGDDGPFFDPAAVYAVPLGSAPSRGPDDALVTIVEFSDFGCKYCNRVRKTLEHVERLYAGQVRWVFRHLPLDLDDPLAAEATLAAHAQGRFWPMHDRLFAIHGRVDRAAVELIAADLGLDLTRFRGDLDAHTHRAAIDADVQAAVGLGVDGTPVFFVNGRPLRGNQPLGVFVRVLDEELARATELVAAGAVRARIYEHVTAGGHPAADSAVDEHPARPQLDPTASYKVALGLDGHASGPDDALVTVVEWSDFECPYCAHNAPVMARLRREYPDDVRVVFRHLPLPGHGHAALAAEASVAAAAQGQFWAFHDRLFAAQDRLTRADLEAIAADLGLDLAGFRAALDERRYRSAVADEAAAAGGLGVEGTPTMFVNGMPLEGAAQWDQLKLVVEVQLEAARGLVARGVDRRDVYSVIMSAASGVERGDPSRMPRAQSVGKLELMQDDREVAVEAACRGRDAERAGVMADRLEGEHRDAARQTCAAYGIDLPE